MYKISHFVEEWGNNKKLKLKLKREQLREWLRKGLDHDRAFLYNCSQEFTTIAVNIDEMYQDDDVMSKTSSTIVNFL